MQYKAETGVGRVTLRNRGHTCGRLLEHNKWKKTSTVPSKKGSKQLPNPFQTYSIVLFIFVCLVVCWAFLI